MLRRVLGRVPRSAAWPVTQARSCASSSLERSALASCSLPADLLDRLELTDGERAAVPALLDVLREIGVVDIAAAVRRHPDLLRCNLEAQVVPCLEYLLNLGIADLGPLVQHGPTLLSCDVTRDLHPRVAILRSLGVENLGRWLSKNPSLVEIGIEDDMRPAVELLRSLEGIRLGKVVGALPTSVFNAPRLQERIDFYRELGIERLGRFVSKHPQSLTYAIETNLQPKVAWLGEAGFQSVHGLLSREPRLLSYAINTNLVPKLEYITKEMGRPIEQVESFPAVLTYSLEHVTARHQFLVEAGKWRDDLGFYRLFRASAYTFARKIAKCDPEDFEWFVAQRKGGKWKSSHDDPTLHGLSPFLQRHETALAKDEATRLAVEEMRQRLEDKLTAIQDQPAAAKAGSSAADG